VRTGVRKCSDEVISKTPNWLVASCIKHKKDNSTDDCIVRVMNNGKGRYKVLAVIPLLPVNNCVHNLMTVS